MDEAHAPLSVFLSYSHRDEELRERLEAHLAVLRRQGHITLSHDEMRRALERHERGEARVVPIVLRPCDWEDAPLGKLQVLPRDRQPVTSCADPEAAWTEVAKDLRGLVDELRERRADQGPSEPEPHYPNDRIRDWSRRLGEAYRRLQETTLASGDVEPVKTEIDDLRRHLREGGLQPGDFLARGRFQLIEAIGSGGFATVWKAFDRGRAEGGTSVVSHAVLVLLRAKFLSSQSS